MPDWPPASISGITITISLGLLTQLIRATTWTRFTSWSALPNGPTARECIEYLRYIYEVYKKHRAHTTLGIPTREAFIAQPVELIVPEWFLPTVVEEML